MKFCHIHQVDHALTVAAEHYDFVLVPGLYDSGPDHWQTVWQQRFPFWKRVTQRKWDDPYIELWISATSRLVKQCSRPVILVGHSFGALASSCVAQELPEKVAGLMLVAPAEPSLFGVDNIVPEFNLGVPSVVVASHNDRVMSFSRAIHWSSVWGADLVDLGQAGHINAEAGFSSWLYGLEVLRELAGKIHEKAQEPARGLMPPVRPSNSSVLLSDKTNKSPHDESLFSISHMRY